MGSGTDNNLPEPTLPEQQGGVGLGEQLEQRGNNMLEDVLQTASGQKPLATLPFRYLGEVGGGIGDIGASALSSITPDFIEEPVKEYAGKAANYLMGTDSGQAIQKGLGRFQENYPDTADVAGGAMSFGPASLGVKGATKGTLEAGKAAEKALNVRNVYPDASDVKSEGARLFKKAEELGANFTPAVVDDLYKAGTDMLPKGEIAKKLIKPDEADSFVISLDEVLGKNPTLDDFQEIDKFLGDKAHSAFKDNAALSSKFTKLQAALRDSVADPKNAIGSGEGLAAHREATRLWSIQHKMRDIQRIIDDAAMYAVPATAIQTGFRRIARNDKLMRGYTPKEQASIRRAAETGNLEGVTKTFGSRLTAIGGAVAGGLPGAALGMAVSGGGRIASEALKKGKSGKVNRLLGERSGLVKKEKRVDLSKLKPALISAIRKGHTPKELAELPTKEAKAIIKEVREMKPTRAPAEPKDAFTKGNTAKNKDKPK